MKFAPYDKNTRLKKNCFGILEPIYQKKHLKSSRQLDMILAPLVGFDEQGNPGGVYSRIWNIAADTPTAGQKTIVVLVTWQNHTVTVTSII